VTYNNNSQAAWRKLKPVINSKSFPCPINPAIWSSCQIIWFPLLHEATPEQRGRYEIGGGGVSLHWPEIDEDLSVANLMAGVDWQSV